jgi:hypothetical protein
MLSVVLKRALMTALQSGHTVEDLANDVGVFLGEFAASSLTDKRRTKPAAQRRMVALSEHFASGRSALNLEQFKALRARQAGGAR